MDEFPFSEAEWARVTDATREVLNATLADDEVLRASCFVTAQEELHALRKRYGDHPVLLETEADFSDEIADRRNLYESAVCVAAAHGLPTLSIRLSFARLLLEIGRPAQAKQELLACEGELPTSDEYERKEWAALADEAGPVARPKKSRG